MRTGVVDPWRLMTQMTGRCDVLSRDTVISMRGKEDQVG